MNIFIDHNVSQRHLRETKIIKKKKMENIWLVLKTSHNNNIFYILYKNFTIRILQNLYNNNL